MNNSGPNTSVGTGRANDQAPQSQQESGGSGGEQLTHNINDTQDMGPNTASPGNRQSANQSGQSAGQAEAAGSAATAANRTVQDTRANQAGSTGTGLGAAETGGNQDEYDMPKE